MSQTSQPRSIRRLVAVVSDSDVVSAAASRALQDLAGTRTVGASVPPASYPANDDYREVIRRGLRFLDRVVPQDEFTLVTAGSLAAVPAAVALPVTVTSSPEFCACSSP